MKNIDNSKILEKTRTKISIIFKEIVDDNILKQIHDVLI